jgi:soluble lytic murein transglycosylase-like protein
MQVMPDTARDPGFGVSPAKADSAAEFDRVGREYLQALHQRYGGNLARMWAAYNMGPGALDRALSKYGDDWLSHVPPSVRQYVGKNLSSAGAL